MKRIGNLYNDIISIENLNLADQKAQKGKLGQYGVQLHNRNKEAQILQLHKTLKAKKHKTSPYSTFKIYEPKEREIFRLPFFPDRIVHHAIMNKLKPIFVSTFTNDTYSCIEGKGIHAASNNLKKAFKDIQGTTYCLKLDIKKFYPNIDHAILKNLLRKKLKDQDLLTLLDEIIDSAPGVPIGNYLSQYFANFYLTYFDHWIKEQKKVKYYFRYADDMVLLSESKEQLQVFLSEIKEYLNANLKLTLKPNRGVFPTKLGIDFVGYVHYHGYTLLRKSIKKDFARAIHKKKPQATINSYLGWLIHSDSNHLTKKLQVNEQFLKIKYKAKNKSLRRRQNSPLQNTG